MYKSCFELLGGLVLLVFCAGAIARFPFQGHTRFRNRFDSTTPHLTPLEEEHAYNRHSINRDGERVSSFRTELCISHSGQGRSRAKNRSPENISGEPAHHSLSPQTHKKYNFKNSQAEIKGLSRLRRRKPLNKFIYPFPISSCENEEQRRSTNLRRCSTAMR